MNHHSLILELESGAKLDVRTATVREHIGLPFSIELTALASSSDVDFESIVGLGATFSMQLPRHERHWSCICNDIALVAHPEHTEGLATYALSLVPPLWLLGQRRNHRIYQQIAEPEIAVQLLDEWGLRHRLQLERTYPTRKYRVQYGESDLDFLRRMLEEAGISLYFTSDGEGPLVVLDDAPHAAEPREEALLCRESPPDAPVDYATEIRLSQRIRPGRHTIHDHDYRLPPWQPLAASHVNAAVPIEESLESFHYVPGGFLYGAAEGDDTPSADDKGKTRTHTTEAESLVERRLLAERGDHKLLTFFTAAYDLRPAEVVTFRDHPHRELSEGERWLVIGTHIEATWNAEVKLRVEARTADIPFRPQRLVPRPTVTGVESATVVGPEGEEIHTDEFGRVRVQFHWDRYGRRDDDSSCWMHVSQPWAGAGFGGMQLPRIGQEVLVDFLGGDPDRPVITGRVYTNLQKVPYRLPEHKTRSTWKSHSSPGREGFNEIMFEDLAGKELVWQQAEKNQRRLVKNDESITVGNDRKKQVKGHEQDTTERTRVEHTHGDRTEISESSRFTEIGIHDTQLVHADRTQLVRGNRRTTINQDDDQVCLANRRSRVTGSSHLAIDAEHRESIGATRSLTVVENDQVRVGQNHALEAGRQIHIKAGDQVVLEAGARLTIKGPGGFIDIHPGGIDVVGTLVRINSGGSAADGAGASPATPDEAKIAEPEQLDRPVVDDVGETGINQ